MANGQSDNFAQVICWCEHDCCEVTSRQDKKEMEIIGIPAPFYDCDVCECHIVSASWDDLGEW